jgi:hypothetical protein
MHDYVCLILLKEYKEERLYLCDFADIQRIYEIFILFVGF